MNEALEFTESGSSPPKRRGLSKLQRIGGEVREVILAHEEAAGRIAARLVKVETGGVDRETGQPLRTYFEVTIKLPNKAEVTHTFSAQGDQLKAEWNARIAYLAAQHGIVDLSTPLADFGERLWPEPKNLTALAKLRERFGWPETLRRTRMNSGDSHADSPTEGEAAISTSLVPA